MSFVVNAADKQRPLEIGETLCNLDFLDMQGKPFSLYAPTLFAWPKAILLADCVADVGPAISFFLEKFQTFNYTNTVLAVVTKSPPQENNQLAVRLKLPFPVLSDLSGQLHAAADFASSTEPRILFFDSNMRLEKIFVGSDLNLISAEALSHTEKRFQLRQPVIVPSTPPVLTVTNVLSPDHCKSLIKYWETGNKHSDLVSSQNDRSRRKASLKSRTDVIIPAKTTESKLLIQAISQRLCPDIKKAFCFDATRFEPFRVGCYDAKEQGHFSLHRDNTAPNTAHRRFALVINLNTGEYKGGVLALPEYGTQMLNVQMGTAMVFSGSLLHFAAPVTEGRRFVIVGFFWGEGEQQLFRQTHVGKIPIEPDFNLIPNTIGV